MNARDGHDVHVLIMFEGMKYSVAGILRMGGGFVSEEDKSR